MNKFVEEFSKVRSDLLAIIFERADSFDSFSLERSLTNLTRGRDIGRVLDAVLGYFPGKRYVTPKGHDLTEMMVKHDEVLIEVTGGKFKSERIRTREDKDRIDKLTKGEESKTMNGGGAVLGTKHFITALVFGSNLPYVQTKEGELYRAVLMVGVTGPHNFYLASRFFRRENDSEVTLETNMEDYVLSHEKFGFKTFGFSEGKLDKQ
jgi:hypothetical protein